MLHMHTQQNVRGTRRFFELPVVVLTLLAAPRIEYGARFFMGATHRKLPREEITHERNLRHVFHHVVRIPVPASSTAVVPDTSFIQSTSESQTRACGHERRSTLCATTFSSLDVNLP